jgi:hypothetical protein
MLDCDGGGALDRVENIEVSVDDETCSMRMIVGEGDYRFTDWQSI